MAGPALEPELWLSERPVTVVVSGNSMVPFLAEGDRVDVVRAEPPTLRPGQLVVFRRGEEVVVHRLLLSRRRRFLEKGDAQDLGNWWPWPQALGVVVALWRQGRREDLTGDGASRRGRDEARRHLRAHRLRGAARRIPWSLPRRALLRLVRPLL